MRQTRRQSLRLKEETMSVIPFDDRDGFIWYDGRLVPWVSTWSFASRHGTRRPSYQMKPSRSSNGITDIEASFEWSAGAAATRPAYMSLGTLYPEGRLTSVKGCGISQ